ncbi:hypothetical protein AiwAL_19650 [Acidiphilium sp. AL]|uniref:Uncharacterized protein n=1 Tax=Acidiphilium iwatense TaxID=768198 RepID=A0ABS9E3J3_9PROT|nr:MULTISPECIES: hypothetical protein [Acidiphilium]MCF3948903.1 hypothetical protein [Acidiphilium iwatense]MCU4162260.1 hypothetical protein [Acidiphilium sp. AL]
MFFAESYARDRYTLRRSRINRRCRSDFLLAPPRNWDWLRPLSALESNTLAGCVNTGKIGWHRLC